MRTTVLIGIQARSSSTRLPRKAFEAIGGKWMLDHVIDAAKKSAGYLSYRNSGLVRVAVLTPKDDPIAQAFSSRCDIIEGDEKDVLSRYLKAVQAYDPELVVRLTGDCPLIPSFVISRIIDIAIKHRYDYLSNVDERFRTTLDGADCEAISARLLKQVADLAVSDTDREHVTTLIRKHPPSWAKIGHVMNHFDQSGTKLSVDTPEDLENVRKQFEARENKHRLAIRAFGQSQVHLL